MCLSFPLSPPELFSGPRLEIFDGHDGGDLLVLRFDILESNSPSLGGLSPMLCTDQLLRSWT